jgi:hypothetical protein
VIRKGKGREEKRRKEKKRDERDKRDEKIKGVLKHMYCIMLYYTISCKLNLE